MEEPKRLRRSRRSLTVAATSIDNPVFQVNYGSIIYTLVYPSGTGAQTKASDFVQLQAVNIIIFFKVDFYFRFLLVVKTGKKHVV